ncbi:MAG: phytoene desaturase family protein [Bacteroidota bacterium]
MSENNKNHFDIVIIGAGIGGLTSAALLSKSGLSVCVLEANAQAGGYLAKYEKNGYIFDTSIHWLNSCGPDGIVTKIFKFIGKDFPAAQPQRRIKRYLGEDFDFLLTNNPDELKNQLQQKYPDEKEGIEKFFTAAKKLRPSLNSFHKLFRSGETMNIFELAKYHLSRLKFALPFIKYLKYSGSKGKTKGLNKFFSTRQLHDMFANEDDLLSCLIPIAWAYNHDFQNPPEGGSFTYPKWLKHIIKFYGNKIIYNAKAKSIIVENKKCKSVIYERNGENVEVFGEQIIAAIDIGSLYEKMLPKKYIAPKFLEKMQSAELYSSAFTIYISLDCPASQLGFNEEMISFMDKEDTHAENEKLTFESKEIAVFSQSERDKTMAPEGCGSLTVIMPAYFDSNKNWLTTTDEHGNIIRGSEYKKLKDDYAKVLISRVEKKLSINLRKHIISYEIATPISYWRYTNNRYGSMMGAKPGKKNMMSGIAHYKTPLKGLYIGGHWAELGGGVPIAVKAAVNASLLVLQERKHKAYKLIVDYLSDKKSIEEIADEGVFLDYDDSFKP